MDKRRLLPTSLFCILAAGCTYNIVLQEPEHTGGSPAEPMTMLGSARTGEPAAQPQSPEAPRDGKDMAGRPAMPPDGNVVPATPTPGPNSTPAPAGPPIKPRPTGQDGCDERVVSRSRPCSDDPDPCGLNSGYDGDEFCLKPPAKGEGIQIHFGPKSYTDKAETAKYEIEAGQDVNNSLLAHVPLTETKYWYRITVHARPGALSWISMAAPVDGEERVYPDTGCGQGTSFGASGWGGGRNLIYDNPPLGIAAPENEGIGRAIDGNSSACVNLRSYNFTDKPQLRELWVNLYFIDRAKIAKSTGGIGLVGGLALRLPPGQKTERTYMGTFEDDGRIIQLSGQRYQWTTRFAAWLNDELIYDSYDWKAAVTFNYDSITTNPPIDGVHDGAKSGIVSFKSGDVLKYSCFIDNGSDYVLVFKNQLEGGEMCNLYGTTIGGSLGGSFN